MPLDVFTPAINPAPQGSNKNVEPRVDIAEFGDGYNQRSENGINSSKRVFQASWPALSVGQCEALEAFFDAHRSAAFLWTLPLESVQRKWTAGKYTRGYVGGITVSLSTTLTECFDL